MARRIIGNKLDRDNRNNLNSNFEELYNDVGDIAGRITDDMMMQIRSEVNLNWQEPVDSQSDLPSSAYTGDTRMTRDNGTVYRYNGNEWIEIQQLNPDAINEVEDRLQEEMDTKETPDGAQQKADSAEQNANEYADDLVTAEGSDVVRVVEQISDSNGDCIRYSNGVQECWLTPVSLATNNNNGDVYTSDAHVSNFPAEFISEQFHAVANVRSRGKWANTSQSGSPTSSILVYQIGGVYASSTFTTDIYVRGRWR